ncbi:hypothetical protein [Exercitatus varius]|uniref:hypothetical protein n=1 Tax=Exercitatus varius TaxID=67857 RepID=UPI00294ACED8|nr:hypothetical protein [Exercitatus varius]MDG2962958.1 hypothetical protein [Exercitatus varius]
MVRYRWYKLLTKKDINFIYKKIQSIPFDDGNKKGFIIESASEKNVNGVFYYIVSIMQENANVDIINAVNFSISKVRKEMYLRIHNPSHSIKAFSDLLFEVCDFDLAFDPISISFENIKDWIKHYNLDAQINLIKISDFKINEDITTEITFKSRKELNLLDIDLIKGRKYNITSMSWLIFDSGKSYKILVSKTGLITISEYLALDIIRYVENQILDNQ